MKRIFRKFVKENKLTFSGSPSKNGISELSINFKKWLLARTHPALIRYIEPHNTFMVRKWVDNLITK